MNVSISQWISQKLQTLVPFSPRSVLNKAVESLFKKRTQTQQLNYPSLIQSHKNLNVSPLREPNITHLLKNRSLFNYRNQQGENHSWMFRDFGRSMCSIKEKVSKSQKSAKGNENQLSYSMKFATKVEGIVKEHPIKAGSASIAAVICALGTLGFSLRAFNQTISVSQKKDGSGISAINTGSGTIEIGLSEKKKSTTSPSPTGSSSVENNN